MVNPYMHGQRRKAAILREGLALWREGGEAAVSARKIGKSLGLTHSGCLYHFDNSAAQMKREIADHAVALADVAIIRRLIVSNHPAVAHMDAAMRATYLAGA